MKTLIAALLIATPLAASAGGMSVMISERPTARPTTPVVPDWAGPYLGLSRSHTVSENEFTETFLLSCKFLISEPEKGEPEIDPCPEQESYDVTTTYTEERTDWGLFAGYRWDVGFSVVGLEANLAEDFVSGEVQIGLPLDGTLPYVFAGIGEVGDDRVDTRGLGVDQLWGPALLGVKAFQYETQHGSSESIGLRAGLKF